MKKIILPLGFLFFISCESVSDQVKKDKEKFIAVAKEQAALQQTDAAGVADMVKKGIGQVDYLGVEAIGRALDFKDKDVNLDSIIVFTKEGHSIFYDFRHTPRDFDLIKKESSLKNIEKIDERLYVGK